MRQNRIRAPALSGTYPDVSNSKHRRPPVALPRVRGPDLCSAVLAAAGLCLTLYLLVAHQFGSLPGCPAGGGCDLVQQSRWASLWGIPIAGWGMAFYATLLGLACWPKLNRRYDFLLPLSLVGLGLSLYLNAATWRELRVFCPYCLVSLSFMAVLSARAWWCTPTAGGYRWWLGAFAGLVAGAGVLIMHQGFGGYENALSGPRNPYLGALAEHLSSSGAHFYGASWCPHCQHQKALFGPAYKQLPYVECSPSGPGTEAATDCTNANVTIYPTWVIRHVAYPKLLTIRELAMLSGFDLPEATSSEP